MASTKPAWNERLRATIRGRSPGVGVKMVQRPRRLGAADRAIQMLRNPCAHLGPTAPSLQPFGQPAVEPQADMLQHSIEKTEFRSKPFAWQTAAIAGFLADLRKAGARGSLGRD
jgi:hypothetical protein